MEDYITKTIIIGVISWTTTFLLARRTFPKRSFDFCNRVVSTIHATLAVTLATLSVEDWKCPICPLAAKSSHRQVLDLLHALSIGINCDVLINYLDLALKVECLNSEQMQVLAVSLSYLIYDLVCCFFGERVNLDNIIHHFVSIVGLGAGLCYQKCGSEMVGAIWVTEMSSPFLHMRELLKELGYRDTLLNLTADILFAAIFIFARMLVGPCITYLTLSANNPLLIKAMGLGLQLVSTFWFFKILRMMKHKLTKRPTSENGTKHTNIMMKTTNSQFQDS
ncbi:uncharacterized protein LOC133300749 isoform X1 [Gastrolobium bilobum]|uniref:uncharacterized protein LOC133300749 isoform X1 n=1 Tax=Gastrolobium bilobum TaxID=150636 RepID=UPI002AB2AB3F|nr:uncharacterized protein LOC133300749 isoform X1 [Gastrolobium bilobum]XP_061356318.1 uncharacterized protein LOC133300749 isoform X1 [Gastrolobium bilobum]